jgi:hypothetical protein
MADRTARRTRPPQDYPRASGGQDIVAATPLAQGREMRLLMGPSGYYANALQTVNLCRWVTDNGWPGRCAEDCWHITAEAALDCFEGRRGRGR